MQKLLLFCLAFCLTAGLSAQDPIYVEQFDGNSNPFTEEVDGYTVSQADGQLVIMGDGSAMAFSGFYLALPGTYDLSSNPQIYVRANDATFGTTLRVDLVDVNNNFSSTAPVVKDVDTEFTNIEFDYANRDLGEVDISQITALFIYIDPNFGSYSSTMTIDYVSLGAEIAGPIISDVYQDHMDSDSLFDNFIEFPEVLTGRRSVDDTGDSTVVVLEGLGDYGDNQFQPIIYNIAAPPTFEPAPIDITENRILYVRARSLDAIPPLLRIDVQDVDEVSSNRFAINRTIGQEWRVYEYDFTGAEGLPLEVTPACPATADECIVNLAMIQDLLIYINPGGSGFVGEIEIDWMSFGTNLEGEGPSAPLVYADNFNNNRLDFTGSDSGFGLNEAEDVLSVTGTGTDGDYSSFGYQFHTPTDSQDTLLGTTTVDLLEGQNRIYVRARTLGDDLRLRLDVIDTMGRSTDNGIAQIISNEWQVVTYDFDGSYVFNDYGAQDNDMGDTCNPDNPCTVDASVIGSLLMFPNPDPDDGTFNGTLELDWISVGRPLDGDDQTSAGVAFYSDDLEDADDDFSGEPAGIMYSVNDGVLSIVGDGMNTNNYQQIRYRLTDDAGNPIKGDLIGSGDELLISARILGNDAGEPLRIDIYDEDGFETNLQSQTQLIQGDAFQTYTYNFRSGYTGADGGFTPDGPCAAGESTPCDVDGERVTELIFYASPTPDDGPLVGSIEVDWISFGVDLSVSVSDFEELTTLKVFPNPARDRLGVQYELVKPSNVTISLFDALGRRQLVRDLGTRTSGENFEDLDVATLPVGTYHMQILVDGKPTRAVSIMKR